MKKIMNPIAIWNRKYEDYGDWCYDYRIPDIDEFINGFKYEFTEIISSTGGKKCTRLIGTWKEYTIPSKDHNYVLKYIDEYLREGYIRIKKQNNIMNAKKEVTSTDKVHQKIFYYELVQFKDSKCNGKRKYIVLCAYNPKEGYDKIIYPNYIKCLNGEVIKHSSNRLQKELDINNETGYRISSGGFEITEPITFCDPKDILYYGVDRKDITFKYNKVWSEFIKKVDKQLQNNKKIPKLNIFSKILDRVKNYFLSPTSIKPIMIEVKSKKEDWKPKLTKQQDKSPNRLVYIATKDKLFVKRLPWHEANDIVKSNSDYLPTINPWQFISKEEGKRLQKPKPGISFIPSQGAEIDPKTKKRIYTPGFKEFSKEFRNLNKLPKAKRSHKEQGNKLKQYEVDNETLVNELGGESHSNRTSIFAYSEEKAKNKALKKDVKEGILHIEKGRHGERKYLDRKNAISSLKVKRLDESDTLYQLKRDRSTTVFFMPKIKDLLEPRISIKKDKPEIDFNSKIGDSIKLIEDKTIKTSTTYERVIPLKKEKKIKTKKWRCPINETSEQRYNRKKLSKLVNEEKLQELKLRRIPAYILPNNKTIKIKKKKLIKEII